MFFYIQPNQMRRHWTRTLANQSFVSFYKNRPRLQFYWLISLAQSPRMESISYFRFWQKWSISGSAAKALNWQMHLSPFELFKICRKLGSHTPRRPQNYIKFLFWCSVSFHNQGVTKPLTNWCFEQFSQENIQGIHFHKFLIIFSVLSHHSNKKIQEKTAFNIEI